jgi:UDP-3-O-[3-hydroxymyristoyl] glucosamine N-acyltransferase
MFYLNNEITIEWLSARLSLTYKGNGTQVISNIATLSNTSDSALVFSKSNDVIIGNAAVIGTSNNTNCNLIVSENPRLDFIRALEIIEKEIGFKPCDTPAIIHPSSNIGKNVVIEDGVVIGANSVIEHNVVLFSGTIIGENCLIRANTSIGGDGFGYERYTNGTPIKFIHLGGVCIGNNVEVGSNTCIAKGTLGNTIIEDNVKIDNLVHIAHNCILRDGAFVIACSIICGGVEIGKNAWIAPNATITQKANVGENSVVGLGAVVTKDVEAGSVVAGNPAKVLRRSN